MELNQLKNRFNCLFIFVIGISSCTQAQINYFQGYDVGKIDLSNYIDTTLIDLLLISSPFTETEVLKSNKTVFIDTLETFLPEEIFIYEKYKINYYNILFGSTKSASDGDYYFKKTESKINYNSNDWNSLSFSELKTILNDTNSQMLSKMDVNFISYSLIENDHDKLFIQSDSLRKYKKVVMIQPISKTLDKSQYFYNAKMVCEYYLFLNKKQRFKFSKLISREFELGFLKIFFSANSKDLVKNGSGIHLTWI